ncbi:tetraacyldisaccharide 4'-kinase [Luteolibacter pohnpeiensis]|uniref:Tetraacyldisaccharide 4'-kinase n=1 Tax=Luteolibacter pohnpeiensis TaxID=454153 RepID=A0A934VV19_9BACT|nr:tetraacyldisaccharide 4'-kinase [Luteolibacter pohnpeiensis]MBK1883117.1 tetraacyldisaccharide 4'-kinase [Luteolibacter pohnpeiensis]
MKEWFAELESWGADVIFGRARGFRATMMRMLMSLLSVIFRVLVQTRLMLFRTGWKPQHHLGTKVISIGNLTMGGTGKTPVVELLAKSLRDRGRTVAILSRGYKSKKLAKAQKWQRSDGKLVPADKMPKVVSTGSALLLDSRYAGDEPFMLAKNLDGVSVVVDKDRVKGGRFAINELGADTLLLDDGMQYLGLAHGIDIVLVDARSPFGTEALLPRGTLREPPKNLRRASYIFITKCDGSDNSALISRIRRYNKTAEIMECDHGPIHLENVFTRERKPLEFLQGKWTAAVSAIAVPENFERSLKKLGARVEVRRHFPDHYRFSRKDIDQVMQRCVERDMELIVTTEKDAVRFPRPSELNVPIYFLRIEVDILKGADVWDRMIDRLCTPYPPQEHVLRTRHAYRA